MGLSTVRTTLRVVSMFTILVLVSPLVLAQQVSSSKEPNGTPESPASKSPVAERYLRTLSEPTFTPVELQAVSTPITLNQEGDARTIYETIGRLAHIAVLFDPDYVSRSIHIDLQQVPLQDALQTTAYASSTFWRPVNSKTVFVAADTLAKRREIEQSVVKVFYLPYGTNTTEVQDVANSLRTILNVTRVQPLAPGAVAMRGTPEEIKLAGKLIDDINKSRQKFGRYRVEVRVAEMDGQTKLNSRSYRLFLLRNQELKFNLVPRLPSGTESEPATDKDKSNLASVPYQNIDCNISAEGEHEVSVIFRGTFSDFSTAETAKSGSGDVRQFSIDARPTLTLDKPTLINSFDDPATKHTVQVELTVTRLPET